MNKFVASIVVALVSLTFEPQAQTGLTGTWRVEAVGQAQPWTLNLKANGTTLTGAVSSCGPNLPLEIYEGIIDGDTIRFECRRPAPPLTIAFTGRINGDELELKWTNMGPGNVAANHPMFGASAPPRFIAKRVPDAAVTFDRILHADREPQNWLTYSGSVLGQRYSPLTQLTPGNVRNLEIAWIWQAQASAALRPTGFEATPLVVDGVLYTVHTPNQVVALDAATGNVRWTYRYEQVARARSSGGGSPNRGLAVLGTTLFVGTIDAHLLAIDAYTGSLVWNTTVANAEDPDCKGGYCYVITHAPLVVKDKVVVGVGGGDGTTRCFLAAFDATTGKEVWRFYTIPAPGEPGNETWSGDSWKTGGVGVWNTGAYDADLNLTYWGTGNPSGAAADRPGDNLYSDSVIALDSDTGALKWHYQFTPNDDWDWDSTQVPVLTEIQWQGNPRKVMLWANRNGFMYVLDRATGQFLMGKPFVEVNWMSGFDEKGRPLRVRERVDTSAPTLPFVATNWYPPSYSPKTGLFYIPAWERLLIRRPSPGYGALRAFDPQTGDRVWEFRKNDGVFAAGALTTASNLLFTGLWGDPQSDPAAARLIDGLFYALDARTGEPLWTKSLPWGVRGGPISYAVDGKQFVAVAAGNTLWAFALRQ